MTDDSLSREQLIEEVKALRARVAESERTGAELQASEERFRLLVEKSVAGVYIIQDGLMTYVNPTLCRMLGYQPEEIIGRLAPSDLIHADDVPEMMKGLNGMLEGTARLETSSFRAARKDGSLLYIELYGVLTEHRGRPAVIGTLMDITDRKRAEEELRAAFAEIQLLKEQLEAENVYLREEIKLNHVHGDIVGESPAIRRTLALVEQVAPTGSTVLVHGETGTGKELLARSIHNLSPRKDRPLVAVNCAAMPSALIESELFGREKGAYTGALTRQAGRFEVADKSTLFLDEVGELSLEAQAKLLRVLQEGKFERLGSSNTITVDVRVIAATNRDLEQAVRDGKFREDLFYRLNVFPITVPPLRERREDIPVLVWTFVREFSEKMGKRIESIPKKTIEALSSHPWPGNVRALRNAIERAMILSTGTTLKVELPGAESHAEAATTLDDVQRSHIVRTLEATGWRIRGEGGAAERLGLKPTTLEYRMKRLGIRRRPEDKS
jgi:formate hydrogenlyase transcriptional activator